MCGGASLKFSHKKIGVDNHNKSTKKDSCFLFPNFSRKGIDVSHHNRLTKEDFRFLHEKYNVTFVYIKASEGATFKDNKRKHYVKCAKYADIPYGFYHFYRDKVPAKVQYANFKQAISFGWSTALDNPLAIDYEDLGKSNHVSKEDSYKNLKELVKLVENDLGVIPLIYCNAIDFKQLKPILPECKFWVCGVYPFGDMMQVRQRYKNTELDFNYR